MARKSRKNQPAEPENPKAVVYKSMGYTRISKAGEKSDDSIENQAAIIREYVKDKPDIDLRGVITADAGYTGTDFDRPGYAGLMAGIMDGTITCVLVKDLSRLGRTYIEVGELLFDTFPACNVRFISVNDNYDSFADDAGRKKLLILFKNLVNHLYSRDLGKKIRSAHDAKKRRGEPAGGKPYGYRRSEDGRSLAVDSEAADIVKRIFDMRQSGESANGIVKHLNQCGVPSPQKRRYLLGEIAHEKFSGDILWGAEIVCRMLRNETYTGVLVQGKYDCDGKRHTLLPSDQWIRHEDAHPAIISREQFDAVQSLMAETAVKYRKLGIPSPKNAYAGKIFCARCGRNVQRSDGGAVGRVIYYYTCRRCADELKLEQGIARAPSLTLAKLDAAVGETLRKQMDLLDGYDEFIKLAAQSDALKQKRAELIRERAKLEKEAASADNTIAAAYTHHLDGLLDFREYELVRDKAVRAKENAAARLAYMDGELQRLDANNAKNNPWRERFNAFRDLDKPTKEIVQALVSRITVTPLTNEVSVELNCMDSFAELRELVGESGVRVNA
jgi:DNA invertase Pin-like site-specific DNA recombinase